MERKNYVSKGLLTKLLVFIVLFSSQLGLDAKRIDKTQAINTATLFFKNSLFKEGVKVKEIKEIKEDGNTYYYQINFEQGGWTLISADDRTEPIIGYSIDGAFCVSDKSPVNIQSFIKTYTKTLDYLIANNEDIQNKAWKELEKVKTLKTTQASVSPLIPLKWNQGRGFNQYCPEDANGPDGHALVGCVAVAMGQALYVSKTADPQGFKQYNHDQYGSIYVDFDKEPDYDWSAMSTNSGNEETARLLFHCGVAVEMGYGADGSGAYTSDVDNALRNYFGFSSQTVHIDRYEDDNEWVDLMKSELDKSRPIIYAGNPPEGGTGHAWNVDGYDSNGLFHLNWGWGGANNGYFNINAFKEGDNDYTAGHEMVIGLGSAYMGPTNITLSSTEVMEFLPIGTYVADIEIDDLSTNDSFMYSLKGNPLYGGGYGEAKFYVEDDKLYTSEVFNRDERDMQRLTIEVTDRQLNTYSKSFEIDILDNPTADIDDEKKENIKLYPNPTADKFTIDYDGYFESSVGVYSMSGNLLLSKIVESANGSIDVSELPSGMYLVVVKNQNGSILFRDTLIKK